MAQRVYWWHTRHPHGECPIVVVAVLAGGVGNALTLIRRAGFHGLKKRAELGPAPDWVAPVPTANPGRVCWCPHDCTVAENWEIEP